MASEPGGPNSSSFPETLSDSQRSAARYLFAISTLSKSDTDQVTTGELQEYLNVTPASVTEIVSKLDEQRLVDYEKYHGVKLTDRGEAIATRAGWRFCIVSTFFDSVLDMSLDDETAFDIEFVLPKTGVFRLRELVDTACLGLCPESGDEPRACVT